MNLLETIEVFLGEKTNAGTKKSYRQSLKPMSDYLGPARPVSHIQPIDLVQYAQILRDTGIADATYSKRVRCIRTYFKWLVDLNLLETSPALAMKKPRVSRFVRKDKAMTDEELFKILEYVQWKPRDDALVSFLADTGSRAGGAAGLTWDLVDFERYRATVTEKGHKTRTVFLGDLSVTKLLYWFEKQNRIHGNYVFSRNGQPINSPAISSVVRRASKQVGIRSLGAHSIRHRKGHQFSANRLSPKLCQIALGHMDVVTTINHYYEDDDSHVEAAMRELALPMTVEKPDNIVEFRKAK